MTQQAYVISKLCATACPLQLPFCLFPISNNPEAVLKYSSHSNPMIIQSLDYGSKCDLGCLRIFIATLESVFEPNSE